MKIKRIIFTSLKVFVSGALLFYLSSKVNFSEVEITLQKASLPYIILAGALLLLQIFAGSFRWCAVTKIIAQPVPFWTSLKIIFIGHFFNQFLPSSIGGDAIRVLYVRSIGISTRLSIASILLDRLVALAAVGLLIIITFPITYYFVDNFLLRASILGSGLLILILFLLSFYIRKIPRRYYGYKITADIRKFSEAIYLILSKPKATAIILLLSIGMHLISGAVIYSVALGFGLSVSLFACLALTQPITLITVLPISIAGWGIREAGLITVLAFAGVTNNDALVVSIVFGILLIIVTLPGGIFLLFKNKMLRNNRGENL